MDELNTEASMTPMNYLKIFFRRKEFFLIPAFVGLIVGICAGIILPKKYISSTILLVEEGKTDNPLFSQIAISTTVGQRMQAIRESMLGWNSLVTLVQRLGLEKNAKNPKEFEELILGIRKDIAIRLRANNIIDLAYVGNDPVMTRDVVKNVTEIFIERNVNSQNQETADAILFIEEQLKLYRSKIKSAQIAQLRENLNTLLLDSTEKHPQVKQLREQLVQKEEELKKENLQYIDNVELDSKTVNPIISEIRKALDNIEGGGTIKTSEAATQDSGNDLYKVMLVDKLDQVMARDVDVNDKIYNMLLSRLETAKITQRLQSSKEGTKYTILDPPRVPLKASKPNKVKVAMVGLFIGMLVGAGLVLGGEFLDKSFIDVEDANNFFKRPLLGAISKIHTEFSLKHQREKVRWLYSLTLVFGVIAVILTAAITNFLN